MLLVSLFFRAVGAIDMKKNGYDHLQEMCERIDSSIPMQTYYYVYLNISLYIVQIVMNLLTACSAWRYMCIKENKISRIEYLRILRMEHEFNV